MGSAIQVQPTTTQMVVHPRLGYTLCVTTDIHGLSPDELKCNIHTVSLYTVVGTPIQTLVPSKSGWYLLSKDAPPLTPGWSQLGTCDFDTACLQDYNDIEPQQYHLNNSERCPVVQNALQCLESFPCVDFALQLFKGHLRDLIAEFECQPAASPAPTPSASSAVQSTPSPTPVSCPSLPHTLPCDSPLGDCCPHLPPILPESCDMPILQDLGTPDLHPPPAPSDCSVSEDDRLTLQHCSMLTYSHLRPFGAYGLGIQLCSLPGSWYMVKHPGFSVEVSADSESVSCPHTLLRKVNSEWASTDEC